MLTVRVHGPFDLRLSLAGAASFLPVARRRTGGARSDDAGRGRGSRQAQPPRRTTFFEAAVIAVTEQQLSIVAAFHIRMRLITRFDSRIGELARFPSPAEIAATPLDQLGDCGSSRRKAKYIKALAERIARGHWTWKG